VGKVNSATSPKNPELASQIMTISWLSMAGQWILRTGAPWRDLPERYGKLQSVATRFYRWQKAGIWQQVLENLQADADAQGKLDWPVHYVDGSVIRAHQHAAGGKKGANKRKNEVVLVGVLVEKYTYVVKAKENQ
jgi:transposase